ncbi:MAG: hypothetical protein L0215_15065 [Gemmataceae bacterium]|nr:hypothetical protein [Gemmataceae bacterium]
MLESASLLLKPWSPLDSLAWTDAKPQGALWTRTIVDPATDQPLGFASWDRPGRRGLLFPLAGKAVRVFETEDASLLMSMRRPWGLWRMWEIIDAEEHWIGSLYADVLFDRSGARLARWQQSGDSGENAWVGERGLELASWQTIAGQDMIFRFGETQEDNPFLRMATLAGVLLMPPWPV